MPVATGFIQTQPDEGRPATERTEVRVLFDEDTIYFGFVFYDRDPDGIITSASRRDASLNNSDSIQIILDTFRDRQSAFVFGTSPAGQEYDGQVMAAAGSVLTTIGMARGWSAPRSRMWVGAPSLVSRFGRSVTRIA